MHARLLLSLLPALFPGEATTRTTEPASGYRIELEVRPIVDLYCELRVLAASPSALPPDDARSSAVEAIRALDRELGPVFLGWGLVEGGLVECHTGADLTAAFEALPETWELPGPRTIALRAPARSIASAVAALEADWLRDVWPKRVDELMAAASTVRAALESRPQVLAEFAGALELAPNGAVVPLLLVHDTTPPGAYTYRRPGGGGVCFVSVDEYRGSQLLEVVLHESLHALETLQGATPSLLSKLRDTLTAAGVGPRDAVMRNVPHTLFFVHAADTVRRHLAPEHDDYGDVEGYYAKVAPVAEYERPLWTAYRSGELDADALIAQLVEASLAER